MKSRSLRNLLSTITLFAFVFITTGTSYPRPVPLGEFPLAMRVHGDTAYLLHFATGPYERGPRKNVRLSLSALTAEGGVRSLQELSVPAVYPREIAGVVTTTSEGALAFAIAASSSRGSYAVVVPQTSVTEPIFLPNLVSGSGAVLAMLKRDSMRYRVYFARNPSTPWWKPATLPLFEIENGAVTVLANDVVWAHCGTIWCQHVRIEGSTLRLYANPVTSDLYLQPVSEFEIKVDPKSLKYDTYAASATMHVLTLNHVSYALSLTDPSMTMREPGAWSSDPAPMPIAHSYGGLELLQSNFSTGEEIRIVERTEPKPDRWFCDEDCLDSYHEVSETWVEILGRYGTRLRYFPLHDY